VKDAIGEWHDWEELVNVADRVIDHGSECRLIQQLKSTTRNKFESALSQAEQLRKRYFRRVRQEEAKPRAIGRTS
jgi:hypothetical protein